MLPVLVTAVRHCIHSYRHYMSPINGFCTCSCVSASLHKLLYSAFLWVLLELADYFVVWGLRLRGVTNHAFNYYPAVAFSRLNEHLGVFTSSPFSRLPRVFLTNAKGSTVLR